MRIGVAREIKPQEYRVALTPAGALELDQAREWRTRNTDLATADIAAYVDASARREVRARVLRSAVA